jgi:hypothetical protein
MAKKIELNDKQNKAIQSATIRLQVATGDFTHAVATAALTFKGIVAEQTVALKAVGLDDKQIAKVVKDAVGNACTPQNISKALKAAGINQRKTRKDKGTVKLLTGAAKTAVETALVPAGKDEEKESKGITEAQILKLIESAPEDVQKAVVTSELVKTITERVTA